MTVALTGASGYVGSIIADAVGERCLVRLARRPTHEANILWSLESRGEDLADQLAAAAVTDLIHAAWDMNRSTRDDVERVCVDGSRFLLRAAQRAGVRRFVFISTISAFDEARSVYGRAKRAVEREVLEADGIVLRLGLVHGTSGDSYAGGMLGKIRRSVRGSRIIPMIGGGSAAQFPLDAQRLAVAIGRCLAGDLDELGAVVTLADETPVSLRELVLQIAAEEQRRPVLVPVPWQPIYAVLRTLETVGVAPPVRSDSVLSLVKANKAPDFSATRRLAI